MFSTIIVLLNTPHKGSSFSMNNDSASVQAQDSLAPIYTQLTEILRDVFDDDTLIAAPDLTAAQVDGWDSMGNVRFFLAMEQDFKVRFNASEIGGVKNVGELAALIAKKKVPR
jgi:acyl carrier protein